MTKKSKSAMMKAAGATLAVCSAAAMYGATQVSSAGKAKKTMKKTCDKVVGFVDTMVSMM